MRSSQMMLQRTTTLAAALVLILGVLWPVTARAQIKAQVRPAPTPAWTKGMLPINAESYYNAIECGKQGGENPACVFWDTDLCKNDDYALAWYSAYKQVAYEVWTAVQRKRPVPQPSYQAAQRTRVTISVTPVKGSTNALKDLAVKRSGTPALAMERSLADGGGRFVFDYAPFAPTAPVTIELAGQARTLTCSISPAVLRQMR